MGKQKKSRRLDEHLVASGLANTLSEAGALILAGRVKLGGQTVSQAGAPVKTGSQAEVAALPHPYVGRGGLKLAAALDHFGVSVEGFTCLDVGSSTGGFTDCLLQRGAARVYAVDVGRGQLHWKLRQDPRVVSLEQTHARSLSLSGFPRPFDFFCADVSFISVGSLLPVLAPLLKAGGKWVVLVKPQFEAERKWVEKGGIVRREEIHAAVCAQVFEEALRLGLNPCPPIASPLQGAKGNREFLLAGEKQK